MNIGDETWENFRERVLGNAYMIWHDGGVDEYFVARNFAKEDPTHIEEMLKIGLAQDDYIAIEGIKLLKDPKWYPLLRDALLVSSPRTQVWIATYLEEACPQEDYSSPMLKLLDSPSSFARMDSAIALRHFRNPAVLPALLRAVRTDPEYLVRYHAANSYLTLREIQPVEIFDHPTIFELLTNSANSDDTAKAADLLERLPKSSLGISPKG